MSSPLAPVMEFPEVTLTGTRTLAPEMEFPEVVILGNRPNTTPLDPPMDEDLSLPGPIPGGPGQPVVGPRYFYPRALVEIQAVLADNDGTVIAWQCTPLSVEVHRNHARAADTCKVTLSFRDYPLDPRAVVDLKIAVHIDASPNAQFPIFPVRRNLRFIGSVDVPEASLAETDETVTLEARDYTSLYLDYRWDHARNPIDTPGTTLAVLFEKVRNIVEPTRATDPMAAPTVFFDPKSMNVPVEFKTGRSTLSGEANDSAWDVLVRACDLFGLIPVFELDTLVVRAASQDGHELNNVAMIYGYNIEKMTFKKDFRQKQRTQIMVTAWNPVEGRSVEAIYPPDDDPHIGVRRISTNGKVHITIKQTHYYVEGPYDEGTLLEVAKSIFLENGQMDVEGELDTADMVDVYGNKALLALKNGDRLNVDLFTPDIKSNIFAMSDEEQIAYLTDETRINHLEEPVARALVASWATSRALISDFYVLEATHKWSREDGYSLSVRFGSFVLGV